MCSAYQKLVVVGCCSVRLLDAVAQTNYEAYAFRTVAGVPTTTRISADGECKEARFGSPYGIDFDTTGNVYVADSTNHTIRKITPDCVVSTVAGSPGQYGSNDGAASEARFGVPHGVAVGPDRSLYIADAGVCNIRKISAEGIVTTVAGQANNCGYQDGKGTDALFRAPDGLAVDANGTIWVGDTSNHVIRKVTPDGNVTTFAGEPGVSGSNDGIGSTAHFNQTADLRLDTVGNLYVADRDNHTIRKVTPDARVTTLAGLAGASGSVDGTGSVARFYYPQALAVDGGRNVYVADSSNATVRKIDSAGNVTTLGGTPGAAGYADGVGSAARFNFPRGIAVMPDGTVYVGDSRNSAVRAGLPACHPLNVSIRLFLSSGDNVLIGGFIITGIEPKQILLRGLGPSLARAGVAATLADPVVELHDSTGVTILTNDNWKETQQRAIEATGIPPDDNNEAAIVATLSPGSYTAIERGNNNACGIGLLEVYDIAPSSSSHFANISTRGFVGSGDNVMISGFVLGNHNGDSRVIVRALGPSLVQAGIRDALADPMLGLHDSNGALVTSNDNWKERDEANIIATGVPPNTDLESAMVVTLPPGAYTAVCRGKGESTGTVLIETYNLP